MLFLNSYNGSMVELSIVLGTYNRFGRLRACVESIDRFVTRPYEIIIADGGSNDGSREWAATHPRITLIGERTLHGAVDAYNKAFSLASAPYVAHLNDDAELVGGCLDAACDLLDKEPGVGQVAIPFRDFRGPVILNYVHRTGAQVLYANFGVTRKSIGDSVGWWGDYLHTYGGDCELSFSVWAAGHTVAPLHGFCIQHHREQDELRRPNTDSRYFFEKWAGFRP